MIPILEGTSEYLRDAFETQVFPRLIAFQPDFILISAGFDAHERDHLHRAQETMITEFDYYWITQELTKIANRFCNGRIVSVLEGGYNTNTGPISPLAQSVAFHVRALLNTNSNNVNPTYLVPPQIYPQIGKRTHLEAEDQDEED